MGKTKKLSMEERADYLDLCCAYWVGGCVMGLEEMREHSDNIDLFVKRGLIDDDGITWLNIQLAEASQKSDQAKRAAAIRWGKREQSERNADAMRTHSECNADAMREQCREEREEREDRKTERESGVATAPALEEFDSDGEPMNLPQKKQSGAARFIPPTLQECELYFQAQGYPQEASKFYNYYDSNGWRVGKNKMQKWKSAAAGWISRSNDYIKPNNNGKQQPVTEELMRDIANDIANGGWNFAEGA